MPKTSQAVPNSKGETPSSMTTATLRRGYGSVGTLTHPVNHGVGRKSMDTVISATGGRKLRRAVFLP